MNGYSRLANYQLGGSGFQIKSRRHSSRSKKKKNIGCEKGNEIDNRDKKCLNSCKRNQKEAKEEAAADSIPQGPSKEVFRLPRTLLNKLYSKIIKVTDYGQLHSPNDEHISRENVGEGSSRVSVVNKDVSNGIIKGNSNA